MRLHMAGIGYKRVARWMAVFTIRGRAKGWRRPGRYRQLVTSPTMPNPPQCQFAVSHPQSAWGAEITAVATRQDRMELVVVMHQRTPGVVRLFGCGRINDRLLFPPQIAACVAYLTHLWDAAA